MKMMVKIDFIQQK